MPRARIRTFVWLGFWAWIAFVPAWIFAIWYIGWDLVTLLSDGNAGGTNLLAHVVGGVTGYYLGRWWLSDRKWLIEVELQDEIEHMRAYTIARIATQTRSIQRMPDFSKRGCSHTTWTVRTRRMTFCSVY